MAERSAYSAQERLEKFWEPVDISFADAVEMSHGPYDAAAAVAERRTMAERLERAMQPGESIVHQVDGLTVLGGVLVDAPQVLADAQGVLAIGYTAEDAAGEQVRSLMRFRDLVIGKRYGAEERLPILAVGQREIAGYFDGLLRRRGRHAARSAEWSDITYITELRALDALAQTPLRLTDFCEDELVVRTQDTYVHNLGDPTQKHLHGASLRALYGTAHISVTDVYRVVDYEMTQLNMPQEDKFRLLTAIVDDSIAR